MTAVATRADGRNPGIVDWSAIDWRHVEITVFGLQKRIYRAAKRGEVGQVHKLQRLLLKSWSARVLAVRKVTQDNRGKRTAGVDGVKSLPPTARLELTNQLTLGTRTPPLRRVRIPKPGSIETRPLGIPTLRVRAEQALAKLALEPEWEARFETNSYGFRPGRSAHDAIEAIFNSIRDKAKYALDADIRKCFERIDHQALLKKLNTFPALRRVIKAWLKAGVLDQGELLPTTEGTPQGGVASPLLANVALHGLETAVVNACPAQRNGQKWRPTLVRYADDFVVLHHDLATIEHLKGVVDDWLREMGLELKPEKTRITHTLTSYQGNLGFNFLGFHIRQYPMGKAHSARNTIGQLLGFKTIIKPSQEAQKEHYAKLARIVAEHNAGAQFALIERLNPAIQGWANYHRHVVSKDILGKLDHLLFLRLWRWAKRRHPHQSRVWVRQRYWHTHGNRHWIFASIDRHPLVRHEDVPIVRHTKVQGRRSPYDGDWAYWSTRLGRYPDIQPSEARLLKRQDGKCPRCNLFFRPGDVVEKDHLIPRSQGGSDSYPNLRLLHGHCHDRKLAVETARASVTKTG
jgi:RNA-directed DNA polymerase